MPEPETTQEEQRATRPSALRDLRLAGTVATGLVAGTLGLGALATPLVGWRDWPSALQDRGSRPVQLASPPARTRPPADARARRGVPGSAAPSLAAPLPLATGGTSRSFVVPVTAGAGGIASAVGAAARTGGGEGEPSSDAAPQRSERAGVVGSAQVREAVGDFGQASFQRFTDADGDGQPDAWERQHGLDPTVDDAQGDEDHDGVANITELHTGSLPDASDSNQDGIDDGADDSDGDGLSNAQEQAASLPAWIRDANDDGLDDGADDTDGDGIPNAQDPDLMSPDPGTGLVTPVDGSLAPSTDPVAVLPAPDGAGADAGRVQAPAPEPIAPTGPDAAPQPAPATDPAAPAAPAVVAAPAPAAAEPAPAPGDAVVAAPDPDAGAPAPSPAPADPAPAEPVPADPAPAAPAPAPAEPAPAPSTPPAEPAPAPAPAVPAPDPAQPAPVEVTPAPAPTAPASDPAPAASAAEPAPATGPGGTVAASAASTS
jgi:hypothetical protein